MNICNNPSSSYFPYNNPMRWVGLGKNDFPLFVTAFCLFPFSHHIIVTVSPQLKTALWSLSLSLPSSHKIR